MGLKEAVANVGPISVCIDANFNFMSYAGGGYGHDSATGKDYWLVKNSWNTSWGDKGYIKMVRNKMNQCAISSLASYPTVKPTF
jgi:cathepsin L